MAKKSRNKNHSNNFNIKFMPRLACFNVCKLATNRSIDSNCHGGCHGCHGCYDAE